MNIFDSLLSTLLGSFIPLLVQILVSLVLSGSSTA